MTPGEAYLEGLRDGHSEALAYVWGAVLRSDSQQAYLIGLHEEMREWFKATEPPRKRRPKPYREPPVYACGGGICAREAGHPGKCNY